MKRRVFSEKERNLRKKIEKERELFHYKMLASPAAEIYEACSKIRFYECFYEYFQYVEHMEKGLVEVCLEEQDLMEALWDLYLEREYLKCDTWEEMEEILGALADRTDKIL